MSEIKTLSVLHFTGEKINGKPIIPDDVEDIQYCSFKKSELNEYKGGYYVGTMENPYKYFYRLISTTGDVFLHPDTEYICTDAFYWFRGEMVFNNKLKGIGKHAFRNAFEFQRDAEIIIPDGCKKIGEGAFICKKNCHFTVHLPDTITYIGKGAFQSYPPEKIIASPAVLALIGKNIFVAKAIEYLKSINRSEADDAKWLKEIEGFKTPFVNAAISAENAEALLFAVSNRLIKKSDYDKIFEIADASNNVELKAALVNTNLKPTEKEREKKAEKEFEKAMGIRELTVSDIKKLWQYRTDDDGDVTLTKYIGDEVIPTIPRKIGKANVTRLGNEAFHAQSNITAVYVPDNILFIGDRAFAYCRILETVELPETLLAVGDDLFYCSEKLVNKPDVSSLKIDKPDADIMDRYDYCRFEEIKSEWKYHIDSTANECIIEKYVGSRHNITVPDRIFGVPVTSIASFAFSSGLTHGNCRHGSGAQQKHNRTIESITLPEGIKKIGSCAFSGSCKLKHLNIPVGCMVEEDAFLGCQSLAKDKMLIIFNNVLYQCVDSSTTYGFMSRPKPPFSVTVPEGVNRIAEGAFRNSVSLESIEIPDGVTEIEHFTFLGCHSLKNVKLPSSVRKIGCDAFYGCRSLRELTIPDSVESVDRSAFALCSSLSSVTFNGKIKEIEECVFVNCAENLIIRAPGGSCVEAYAAKNGIKFEVLE